ncbi:MAG: tRNA preQ1(34) S-adenosylmethionine ribosyltransferase-isomerase QueA [Pseudomonadota bacterium]
MDLGDYDYTLPDELIARYPLAQRSASRMLIVDPCRKRLDDAQFSTLPDELERGDLIVVNDTKVIPAQLTGAKDTGGRVDILIERVTGERSALAHVRASKSPRAGVVLQIDGAGQARVTGRRGEWFDLEFDASLDEVLRAAGNVPLPPYLGRAAESADTARYQTVYARAAGAVAAPTAGLHFDEATLDRLTGSGVTVARLTLHVGAGTFQNLRDEQLQAGRLHAERVIVPQAVCDAVAKARGDGGRIVAVGTTTVRSLEAAWQDGAVRPFDGETDLFIRPGYRFRAVDAMLTNFHLPRSSLLLLVAAFCGRQTMLAAYRHAVSERYRFFSYGDCCLLFPAEPRP